MKSRLVLLVCLLLPFGLHAQSKTEPTKLRFMTYDINRSNPEKSTITVSVSVSPPNRTSFVEIGDRVPGTSFRVKKFDRKSRSNGDGTVADVSELTLEDVETKKTVVLPFNRVVESPAKN